MTLLKPNNFRKPNVFEVFGGCCWNHFLGSSWCFLPLPCPACTFLHPSTTQLQQFSKSQMLLSKFKNPQHFQGNPLSGFFQEETKQNKTHEQVRVAQRKTGTSFSKWHFFSLGIGYWLNQKSDVFLLKLIIVDSIDITNLFYWYWICRNYWFQCMCFLLIFLLLLIWSLGDAFWLQIMWRVELSCLAKACVKRVPVPLRRGLTAWILTKEVLHTHPSLKLTQLCLWHVF